MRCPFRTCTFVTEYFDELIARLLNMDTHILVAGMAFIRSCRINHEVDCMPDKSNIVVFVNISKCKRYC